MANGYRVLAAFREPDRELRGVAVLAVGRLDRQAARVELGCRVAGRVVMHVGPSRRKGPALLVCGTGVSEPGRAPVQRPDACRERLVQGDRSSDIGREYGLPVPAVPRGGLVPVDEVGLEEGRRRVARAVGVELEGVAITRDAPGPVLC